MYSWVNIIAMSAEKLLKSLYVSWRSVEPVGVSRLPQAGGDRIYFRISDSSGKSVIGAYGPDTAENKAFVNLDKVFSEAERVVPEIYAVADDYSCYLLEDLGDEPLLSVLHTDKGDALAVEALRRLASMQCVDRKLWDGFVQSRPFSRRQVMWDLNYFKYEYLKPGGTTFDEDRLEDDFERLASALTDVPPSLWGFMYRDFQSRNIMLKNGEPRFIDFQAGRYGPLIYDLVSFLWQAKAGFTDAQRAELASVYAARLAELRGISPQEVLEPLRLFAFFRTLQVLGAYGFRGLVQHRAHFIESIPAALANLRQLTADGIAREYPELNRVCSLIADDDRFTASKGNCLKVKVFSFSYKKGYPADYTGNGGGFMFDCRAMHNPGRYAEYKSLTGLDEPVRVFLAEKGEAQPFIEHALALTSPAVERYLRRGFTSLQIGFGCTGGQHRSVYCADAVARELARRFPEAAVTVEHREQGITRYLELVP